MFVTCCSVLLKNKSSEGEVDYSGENSPHFNGIMCFISAILAYVFWED